MKTFQVNLKEEYPLKGGSLSAYIAEFPWDNKQQAPDWKRPAIIIVPGGGYSFVSKRESEPVALEFLARGFHAFVLTYTAAGKQGERYPEQLFETAASVDYVRKHAQEWCVNPNEIFVVGFSAGGHLTANLAVEHQNVSEKLGKTLDCKPTAVGLSYPVISQKYGHQGSHENLLCGYSDAEKEELLKTLNLDEAVSKSTPPAFIWTTAEDTCVPPDNAIRYALALDKQGIVYELHVYPRLGHGKSTGRLELNFYDSNNAYDHKRISRWLDDCADFFRMYITEKY